MGNFKTIQYGIDPETGLIWSRCGSQVVVPILHFESMSVENNFEPKYFFEEMHIFEAIPAINAVKWTRKIPTEVKNIHREYWGMKPLKLKTN